MEVTRNERAEAWAMKKIKEWLDRRPRSKTGWHVSDIQYPLKAYWNRLKPLPTTDQEALYFIMGHGHHNVLEALLGPKKKDGPTKSDAGEFEKHGILFSPDLRMQETRPLEIKTSRMFKIPEDDEAESKYEGYLKQETAYQALMDQEGGTLLVFFLNAQVGAEKWVKKPALRIYDILMSDKELKQKVKDLVGMAKLMTEAVKKKNPKTLPLCPVWLCKGCKWYKKDCKPWTREPKLKGLQDPPKPRKPRD